MQTALCSIQLFTRLLVSRHSPVVARYTKYSPIYYIWLYHSLANRHAQLFRLGRYDQSDLPDVIILLKVIVTFVSLFC